MVEEKVHHAINFDPSELTDRQEPRHVLICSPTYFDIVDEKNIHMKDKKDTLDKEKAYKQWESIKKIYGDLQTKEFLDEVHVIEGQVELEDMIFVANQSFPWNNKKVILSNMKHDSRQKEIKPIAKYYHSLGYETIQLQSKYIFEGMGDLLSHPGKNLLYGGFGKRTEVEVYDEIAAVLNIPIVALELVNDNFYHLDTAFMPLDEKTAMVCHEAFTDKGLFSILNMFEDVISIPYKEALNFAMNGHCLTDQNGNKVVIIQKGSPYTIAMLNKYGIEVIEVETSEFIKSGGSVFCLKMMIY